MAKKNNDTKDRKEDWLIKILTTVLADPLDQNARIL